MCVVCGCHTEPSRPGLAKAPAEPTLSRWRAVQIQADVLGANQRRPKLPLAVVEGVRRTSLHADRTWARRVNPGIEVLLASATRGDGMQAWLDRTLGPDIDHPPPRTMQPRSRTGAGAQP